MTTEARRCCFCLALLLASSCAHGSSGAERPDARAVARAPAALAPAPAFFEELASQARALAEQPATAPRTIELPGELRDIDYDAYRNIRFRPEKSLWRGEPGQFEVQFFHPGPGYREPVFISVLDGGQAHALPFSTELISFETPCAIAGLMVYLAM